MRADRRRSALALAALLLVPFARGRAAPSASADLDALLRRLGSHPERRARFVERRHSALTRTPLQTRGRLLFRAPDVLEKHTEAPLWESVRIEGGSMTVEGRIGGERGGRTMRLADVPVLAAVVEGLRAALAGDLARLQRLYRPALTSTGNRWELTLTPIDPKMRAMVDRVVLRGQGDQLTTMEIHETGGDRTEIAISPEA